jgi:alkanesulfonate monooxygenase SsuD/methylene tetrahydromethanopterin reductase-like flavin-dependent oxidoreductase (luciferase family)
MTEAKFGVTLPQFSTDPNDVLDGVGRAEAAGLDSVWLFDHLWPLGGVKHRPIFESWTTLSYIAASTKRVLLGTLVTRSSLRHPAVLARMAATTALVAEGRLIAAIGSGDEKSRAENLAFGMPYFEPDERAEQLGAVVEIVRRTLNGVDVAYRGRFAQVDFVPGAPGMSCPVWVGGRSDETLEVAGRLADGWNAWASSPTEFARDAATVIEAAGARPIELSWGGVVIMDETDERAAAKAGGTERPGWIIGSPATVRARLEAMIDAGARHLIGTFPGASAPGTFERFADAVAPLRS